MEKQRTWIITPRPQLLLKEITDNIVGEDKTTYTLNEPIFNYGEIIPKQITYKSYESALSYYETTLHFWIDVNQHKIKRLQEEITKFQRIQEIYTDQFKELRKDKNEITDKEL